ncbi:ATP-binding protein [Elasticomyces elasticus]|nr:ATP-binding protein [Elasticomyces elasticus]KAK3637748.1 ATP-binding protein [Elasticomyces elasticus]KAK4915354.1 ATP-binding protein [Elasticomyces elasticus]KAK5752280.1 ATP-binding protein [Elasticomyces elasticus]
MPSPAARQTYLAISSIIRRQNVPITRTRCLHTTRHLREDGSYHPKDFTTQGHGFTNNYTSRPPVTGPISSSPSPPRITPTTLKQHLDNFVVGQDRAKRVLATAVYNHYQRITELERREAEEEELYAQEERRRMGELRRHPVEGMEDRDVKPGIRVPSLTREFGGADEFPGQQATINMPSPINPSQAAAEEFWRPPHQRQTPPQSRPQQQQTGSAPLIDTTPLTIEKSNILLLGPSGVGKTLMAKTLARVLEVPFSMSDCTPFTQAGYIGEDAEVCVQRLLAAANYDVAKAERGIICLDEIDKIATARVSHGKDVSGEGVQQALLKIIEGTTVQVQAKQERSSSSSGGGGGGRQGGAYGSAGGSGGGGAGGKGEVYNVKTDNILFICAGAFNGLHKMVLGRISKGSIGFGAPIRSSTTDSSNNNNIHETVLEGEEELFEKYLPYYRSEEPTQNGRRDGSAKAKRKFNTLDLVEPQDLQKFGLIPEFVGRLPLSCALSSLDVESLVKVLTEPRNSLLQQYKQLFALSSVELRITSPALRVIAKTASSMGTGARGLKTVLERLLGDAMFETPGSGVKYVLVTEEVAERRRGVWYFGRKEGGEFREVWGREEEAWEEKRRVGEEGEWEARARVNSEGGAARTFEEYREKAAAGGFV